jgi:OPA family glycerol-3-phosphate transporter-like MFS transporter/OPA family sugar phosphate sensor protein UhpC-like MFS transporter
MNGVMNLLDGEGKATLLLVYLIGSLWVVNGYIQGMGVPPCVSLLANWVRPSELATKQSFWNASHSIGAGVVVWLCGLLLQKYGYSAWNLCFAIPAAISLVGAPLLYFGLKDSPSQVGLPQVEELEITQEKWKQLWGSRLYRLSLTTSEPVMRGRYTFMFNALRTFG